MINKVIALLDINEYILTLQEPYRQCVTMYLVDNLAVSEIAKCMAVSPKCVYNRLKKALAPLANEYEVSTKSSVRGVEPEKVRK